MYEVLEDGEPAVIEKNSLYYNNRFSSFPEAEEYLKSWLGGVWELPKNYRGEKFDYCDCGIIVEIRNSRN